MNNVFLFISNRFVIYHIIYKIIKNYYLSMIFTYLGLSFLFISRYKFFCHVGLVQYSFKLYRLLQSISCFFCYPFKCIFEFTNARKYDTYFWKKKIILLWTCHSMTNTPEIHINDECLTIRVIRYSSFGRSRVG